MPIKHYRQELSEYLDGYISQEKRNEIEAHLATCVHCRALVQEISVLKQHKNAQGFDVEPYFAAKVLHRYEQANKESFWRSLAFFPHPLVQTAIIILTIISVILTWQHGSYMAEQNYETIEINVILGDNELDSIIKTDDQALIFALNGTYDGTKGVSE